MSDLLAVRERLLDVVSDHGVVWPDFVELWEEATGRDRPDWQLPLLGHQAVQGQPIDNAALLATVGALQLSIILIDNMLDGDPGPHDHIGFGATSNLAAAFQAASFLCGQSIGAAATVAVQLLIATAAQTAVGQALDIAVKLSTEAAYWQVVSAKSSPYYSMALSIGAAASGSEPQMVNDLHTLGARVGEAVQVRDDLIDALATPASRDWGGRQNLPILYATIAEHGQRDRLKQLMRDGLDDTARLEEAQQILLDCGAADYCIHVLQAKREEMEQLIGNGRFPNDAPLHQLVEHTTHLKLD